MRKNTLTEGRTKSNVKDLDRHGLKNMVPTVPPRPSVFQENQVEYKEVHEQAMAQVQELLDTTVLGETRSSLMEIIEESSTALKAMRRAGEIRKVS